MGKCEITGLIVRGNQLYVIPEMKKNAQTNANLLAYIHSVDRVNMLNRKLIA